MAVALAMSYLGQDGNGIAGPPYKMRQNETLYWKDAPLNDRFNNNLDSGSYNLQYAFAGAGTPQTVMGVGGIGPNGGLSGSGWLTQFTAAQAGAMAPGLWWWQAILTAIVSSFTGIINTSGQLTTAGDLVGTIVQGATITGPGVPQGMMVGPQVGGIWTVNNPPAIGIGPIAMATGFSPARIVAAEGQIVVEADLSTLTGTFDGRSTMEIGLAACENALIVFSASGGRIKHYAIAGREMTFQDDKEIRELADWFRSRLSAEKAKASGGQDRMIRIGFSPASSGTPGSNSRNWPWW
jgi:hypothetical protein